MNKHIKFISRILLNFDIFSAFVLDLLLQFSCLASKMKFFSFHPFFDESSHLSQKLLTKLKFLLICSLASARSSLTSTSTTLTAYSIDAPESLARQQSAVLSPCSVASKFGFLLGIAFLRWF